MRSNQLMRFLSKENEAKNMKDTHSSEEINEWYGNQIATVLI